MFIEGRQTISCIQLEIIRKAARSQFMAEEKESWGGKTGRPRSAKGKTATRLSRNFESREAELLLRCVVFLRLLGLLGLLRLLGVRLGVVRASESHGGKTGQQRQAQDGGHEFLHFRCLLE